MNGPSSRAEGSGPPWKPSLNGFPDLRGSPPAGCPVQLGSCPLLRMGMATYFSPDAPLPVPSPPPSQMAFQGAAGTVAGGGWGAGGSTHRAGPPSTGLTQDTGTRWAVPGAGCVCGLRPGEANRLQAPTQSLWGSPNRKELPPCSAAQPGRPPDTPESQGAEQGKPPSCQKRTFHPWPQSTRKQPGREGRAVTCVTAVPTLHRHFPSTPFGKAPRSPTARIRGPRKPPGGLKCLLRRTSAVRGRTWGCWPHENQGTSCLGPWRGAVAKGGRPRPFSSTYV